MFEIVNFIVGILAIIVSITAIVLSYTYAKNADSSLKAVNVKAENIERDVRDRLGDLVKRAAPSQEEQVMSGAMGEFFKTVMSDKKLLGKIIEESSKKQNKKDNYK